MKQRRWVEHPEARAELLAEVDRLPVEVAEYFVAGVETCMRDVLDEPESWPTVLLWDGSPTLRRRKVKPFRVNIVYYVAGDEVRVIAYAHERRVPGYWRDRLSES